MAKNQRDFFKKKNEWSEIKDTLLRCYLPQYFQKLLVSGKPIFYIDCFAGKFSILIALLAKASLTMEMMAPH